MSFALLPGMSLVQGGDSGVFTESDQTAAFRQCAASHGLRLHRMHLAAGAPAGLQATLTFDCPCGRRWLMRVEAGGVVPAGNVRVAAAPPALPGAAAEAEAALPTLDEVERLHILRVLEQTRGNRARAARILDVDPKTLYNKMRAYLQRTP